jgi:hypothetical protein
VKTLAFVAILLLAGCAAQQSITMLPRGENAARGTGVLDRLHNQLTVDLGGRTYQGPMVMQTGLTQSWGPLGPRTATTTTNQASALLLGDGGQVRCDFGFDALMRTATGVCVDSRNQTYDMLVK